jgi:hypothetical protein
VEANNGEEKKPNIDAKQNVIDDCIAAGIIN